MIRKETAVRKEAVSATKRTYDLSWQSFQEGATGCLDVANAQNERVLSQRAAVRTRGRQFGATVQLIQALGGGFTKGKQ